MDADPTTLPQPEQPASAAPPATPPAIAAPPVDPAAAQPATRRRHRLDRSLEAADPASTPKPRKRLGRPPKGGDPRGKSGVWHVYLPPSDAQANRLREQVEAHCRTAGIPLSVWLKRAAMSLLAKETAKAAATDEATRAAIAAAVAEALAAEKAKAKRRSKGSRP